LYDVVVVGARCAGASTALLLARAGCRVLLLDRAHLPSDTLSTLYVHQPGVVRLARWGLLPAVEASGCPALESIVYETGGIRLQGCAPEADGIRAAYAPRRTVLDAILAGAAVAAGAELRDRCQVVGMVTEAGRVAGVRCRSPNGAEMTERAHLVVGADGMRSTVGRLVRAQSYAQRPRLSCVYYTYWAGIAPSFEIYERPGGWVAALRTNDGLALVAAYFPQSEFPRVRVDAWAAYLANVRKTAPPLWERLAGAVAADRLYGTGDQQNFFRRAWGPGWVLAGDAGHHKDSINAQGIADAFLQADLLAGELAADQDGDAASVLADASRLDAALARFAAERDRRLDLTYQTTLVMAQLNPDPDRLELLRVIRDSPELTERYFGVVAGILPPQQLYTPDLLARIR
jgi:2-polyprenyl-6-methoxyphenol hydroxylase-like FAD-dependent oxidoreductase